MAAKATPCSNAWPGGNDRPAGATRITKSMKLAATRAIAAAAAEDLRPDYIIPSPLDPRVAPAVAAAVEVAARNDSTSGASR